MTIRFCTISEISQLQREMLLERGYHIYSLRDWDDGNGYNIESGTVCVNSIGYGITDREIPMEDGYIGVDDFYEDNDVEDMAYDELRDILSQNNNTNYFYHIKGKRTDLYQCIRTHSLEEAQTEIKQRLALLKQKDETVRAYRFGRSANSYWKICRRIKNVQPR